LDAARKQALEGLGAYDQIAELQMAQHEGVAHALASHHMFAGRIQTNSGALADDADRLPWRSNWFVMPS
jgi:hypothetical protein